MPTRRRVSREPIICPVCGETLAGSRRSQNRHVNMCLDHPDSSTGVDDYMSIDDREFHLALLMLGDPAFEFGSRKLGPSRRQSECTGGLLFLELLVAAIGDTMEIDSDTEFPEPEVLGANSGRSRSVYPGVTLHGASYRAPTVKFSKCEIDGRRGFCGALRQSFSLNVEEFYGPLMVSVSLFEKRKLLP
eukprot:8398_1